MNGTFVYIVRDDGPQGLSAVWLTCVVLFARRDELGAR
jgi:hypothetical protein